MLKYKGSPFSSTPPPRPGQSFPIVRPVVLVLVILGVAYFYLTIHLPLRQSVTQLKIDLARSRKTIVNQEHSLNDLSKKVSQYETTIAELKQQLEVKSPTKPQAKEEPEVKEAGKKGEEAADVTITGKAVQVRGPEKKLEKPKPVASISKPHPYVLHIASLREPKALLSYVNLWQKRGYAPFIVLTQVSNKGYWYRIYLDRFESRTQANRLALKLKREKLVDDAIPMKLPYALEPLESGERVWQKLKGKGYSPYTLPPAKILIGAYGERHEAEEASRRLAAEGFPNRIAVP